MIQTYHCIVCGKEFTQEKRIDEPEFKVSEYMPKSSGKQRYVHTVQDKPYHVQEGIKVKP